MDNFDYNNPGMEPVNNEPAQQTVQNPAPQADTTYSYSYKKRSPFADSPYEMPYAPRETYITGPDIPEKPKKQKKSGAKAWKKIAAAVLAVALVAGSCAITASVVSSKWEQRLNTLSLSMEQKLTTMQEQLDAVVGAGNGRLDINSMDALALIPPVGEVYENCKRSVVAISNLVSGSYGQAQAASTGSGFIISSDGYIVSNYHVVEGADVLQVVTYDGVTYDAEYIGGDETNDVALLKVDATDLPAVAIGSSDDLIVGDQVVAIGNPLGELTSTMTVGYISGKDRAVTTDGATINMLQTDAAINPGNSGGPLFNMNGEVIGITTAKYSGTTASGATIEGIGFAIPIDDVTDILSDLKNYGYVTGAYLGVMVSDMDSSTAAMYRLPVGAYVQSVTQGSCAERAGLVAQDIIIELGGYEVGGINDLTRALRKYKAGDTVTMTVFRAGQEVVLTVTLDEKPHETADSSTETPTQPGYPGEMPENGSYDEWWDYFFGGGND